MALTTWMAALAPACGGSDDTTASSSSVTGDASSSSSGAVDPTTTTTEDSTSSTSSTTDASSSSGAVDPTTGEPMPCDTSPADCGITEMDIDSFCTEPPPASDTLVLEAPGPGQLKISEIGFDQACNVAVIPQVTLGPNNSIVVSYAIQGNPEPGCICKFTITTTLGNLPSGKWTVYLGPFQDSIEVL